MANRPIDAAGAFSTPRYVQAVEIPACARVLVVSGQVGVAADGVAAEGFEAQAKLVFANLSAQLAAAGMGVTDIVKLTTIVTDAAFVGPLRTLRADWLGSHRTASTLLVAGLADAAWLVEIEAIAAD